MTQSSGPRNRRGSGGQPQSGQSSGGKSGGKAEGGFRIGKLWSRNEEWDKDELGDVIHWLRQVVGLVCGLVWGLIPLTGGTWLLAFLVLNAGLVFVYYSQVLRIDDEEYGGHSSLLQEGLMPSIGIFLLCWILVYSGAHFQ